MQAIILAAGRGTRFGDITKETPKPLIEVHGKALITYALDSLPEEISEIIVLIDHLGEKIQKFLGSHWRETPIRFVSQGGIKGTAGALWSARPLITSERFLILNSDDIYTREDVHRLVKENRSFGVWYGSAPYKNTLRVEVNSENCVTGLQKSSPEDREILVATGAYVLDSHIFEYDPVKLPSGEYGLPQTIIEMSEKYSVKAVRMERWLPVNSPEDLRKTEVM